MGIIRRALKIFRYVFLSAAVLLAAGLLLLQIPSVQTFVTSGIADIVSEKLIDADISFGKIHLKPFNTLIIKDIRVVDRMPHIADTTGCSDAVKAKLCHIGHRPVDTLFTAGDIIVRFSLRGLLGKSISVNSAEIRDAGFNLVLEDGENSTNLTRMFRIPKGRKKDTEDKEIFHIRDIKVENLRFTMKNYTVSHTHVFTDGIDWNDMDVREINLKARHLRLTGKIMSGELVRLSFREKSGYVCSSLSGRTRVGRGKAAIEDIHLKDLWSDVNIGRFNMLYEDDSDFADFIGKVKMEGEIERSHIDFRTLSFFAPALAGTGTSADIEGKISGTVDNLTLSGLSFSAAGGKVSGRITGGISGLPEMDSVKTSLLLKDIKFTSGGLAEIAAATLPGRRGGFDIGKIAAGETFELDAKINGKINRLNVSAVLSSSAGGARADISVKNLASGFRDIQIAGTLGTRDLDIRKIYGSIPVGPVSMKGGINASIGRNTTVKIDSLSVRRLNFNGYDYTGIAAMGTFHESVFDGKVIANDPNLNFLFQGIISLSGKTNSSLYRFYANIGHADLNALNLDKRGRSEIRLQTLANFTRYQNGDVSGDIDLNGIILTNESGQHEIGNIKISSASGKERYGIGFLSEFAEGTYSGTGSPADFIKDLVNITARRELPSMFENPEYEWSGHSYKVDFRTMDMTGLLSFIAPGVYVAENTAIKADISSGGLLQGNLKSRRLAYREQYVKNIEFTFDNGNGSFNGDASGEELNVAGMLAKNNRIKIFADNDHVGAGFSYENPGDLENKGELVAFTDLSRTDDGTVTYRIGLLPSSLYFNSQEWNIYPSEATVTGKDIKVKNIEIRSGEQTVTVSGGYAATGKDTLDLHLDRFDLSALSPLVGKKFGLEGAATGIASITSPSSERGILVDFICDSTSIGGTRLGNLALSSKWNNEFRRFDISAANDIDGRQTFSIDGNWYNALKSIDMTATLDSIDIGFARPFLEDIFTELGGHVSGRLTAEGPFDRLSITSEGTELEDVYLKVGYTNVGYNVNGPFHIDELGVYFDDIRITDRHDNRGRITGKIGYDHFKNMNFDIGINVNGIEAVDLSGKQGDVFYGHLAATGNISVTGPVNSIVLTADATTSRAGEIHIPISSAMNAGTTNLLKFKEFNYEIEEEDPYEAMMKKLKKKKSSGSDFAIKLRVSTNPEVEAFVELDKSSGNLISGRGNGNIELDINPGNGDFDIKGDYTINSGNCHFVVLGLAARDFIINEGSSIRFTGDIMESTLNIGATYRTKASLSTLIADTTSVNNRRLVECGIQITDKLSNPRLSFSINVPDLDPMIKARVENALSTEDKVQKQFLSLLISNGFIPDEQSGIVNNSTGLYSNVSELMVNQLNNIFQKLDIPLDLGLNYQQNTRGDNIFDVAVSTQLFNNRVVVNGNIGNRQYRTSNSNDVVGDIDIEIKLDRPGAFRLNLFSHSADQYTNYLDNSQRNGIGLTWQQEFNKFGQFVRRAFMGRKRKEAADLEDMKKIQNEEKSVITISGDDMQKTKRQNKKDNL